MTFNYIHTYTLKLYITHKKATIYRLFIVYNVIYRYIGNNFNYDVSMS